jgi:hypothetical protein
MIGRTSFNICRVGALLLMACGATRAAPQDKLQQAPYTTAEYNEFQAADGEKDSRVKIALLDNFSVKYPDSALRPKIYRDYYLAYFSIKDYGRTIEYADKFVALGGKTDVGFRLEALMTRAQAFLASCGDTVLQTPESYARTRAAAIQGLQTVSQYTIPRDGMRGDGAASVLPEREHLEALFYSVAGIAESGLKGRKDDTCGTKKIEIESIKLFSSQLVGDKPKYAEFEEFRETKDLHVLPAAQFEVVCQLRGQPDLAEGDFLLWTAVDFFVGPVTQNYENMKADQIAPNANWAMSAEIQDLKPLPVYLFHPGETRRIVINGFDLTKVLASFPQRDKDNLWPWFIRIRIHVQDRTGKQVGSAERIIRLSPDSCRKRMTSPSVFIPG